MYAKYKALKKRKFIYLKKNKKKLKKMNYYHKRNISFVIDTSASMNQICEGGMSYMDVAKAAIEHFIKIRGRDPNMIKLDKYFLISFEERFGVISGWKENFINILEEIKYLRALDKNNLFLSIQRAFDQINQFRIPTKIDNYGMGRKPWFLKNSVVILITDAKQKNEDKINFETVFFFFHFFFFFF